MVSWKLCVIPDIHPAQLSRWKWMRIAQLSPLYESVPPRGYGGTERVVSYLTEELVRLGHDVTLFASGDSLTNARLIPCCSRSLRLDETCYNPLPAHLLMLERVSEMAGNFDVIHSHVDYLYFPFARRCRVPHLTTLHGRLDYPEIAPLFHEFSDMPLVSISDSQRQPLAFAPWLGTVHHGLPTNLFTFSPSPQPYLAFVGRVSPEKGVDVAIEIALRAGMPLKIGAKVDKADHPYFERVIQPLLRHPLVEFIGEIQHEQKNALLGGATALLFPIDWPEPFGLVMIEAMACGTPVVAFPRGSVREVIDDGVTGFIVETVDEAVAAVSAAATLSRQRCRQVYEARFSAARMTREYLELYGRLRTPQRRQATVLRTAVAAEF
jgi:glycosyltransferase involved in cell wall biosynthesis